MANSSAKSILIVGGSGYLGTMIATRLREKYRVFATYRSHPIQIEGVISLRMSLGDSDQVRRVVHFTRPDIIFFCAGKGELPEILDSDELRALDATQTGGCATLLNIAQIYQPRFVYFSLSSVFDGLRGNYREGDTIIASDDIGKVKAGAENIVRAKAFSWNIVRTSEIIGLGHGFRPTLLDRIRWNLSRGKRVELANDQLHAFGISSSFGEFVERLVELAPRNKILHFGGGTKVTEFELGKAIAKRFRLDDSLISEKSSNSMKKGANLDLSLNCSSMVEMLKIKPLLLEESLDLIQKHLIPSL
jgi:dTDP-4-dehydrorhamnose reductase